MRVTPEPPRATNARAVALVRLAPVRVAKFVPNPAMNNRQNFCFNYRVTTSDFVHSIQAKHFGTEVTLLKQ